MARPSVGTRSQAESDTALFAHVAYRLEGKTTAEIASYASDVLRIKTGENAIRKAPATSARLSGLTQPDGAIRSWLRIDTAAMDFFTALVRVRSAELTAFGGLDKISGVIHVMRLEAPGDLLAFVLYERRSDQARLKARIEEQGEIVSWEVVSQQTEDPAVKTWRGLARAAAEREGLLKDEGAHEQLDSAM